MKKCSICKSDIPTNSSKRKKGWSTVRVTGNGLWKTYYNCGCTNRNDWNEYVQNYAKCLESPVKVVLSK